MIKKEDGVLAFFNCGIEFRRREVIFQLCRILVDPTWNTVLISGHLTTGRMWKP